MPCIGRTRVATAGGAFHLLDQPVWRHREGGGRRSQLVVRAGALAHRVLLGAGEHLGGLPLDLAPSRPVPAAPAGHDQLALVQADRRFHESIVQRIPDRTDRPRDPRLGELFSERQSSILRPGIG